MYKVYWEKQKEKYLLIIMMLIKFMWGEMTSLKNVDLGVKIAVE
jgi:hypothetical protein